MRTGMRMQVVVGLIMLLIGAARAEEFPADVVRWVPALNKPVFQGAGDKAWDRYIRERGWILIEEGTYHLWYTGFNKDRSPLMLLGHATSPDGLRWTRDKTNPLETSSWVEDMCVVHRGDMYFMFAEGNEDIAQLPHLLTSHDGVRWVERGPLDVRKVDGSPIAPGLYGTPTVWVENDLWYLFYERQDLGIWLATSKEGMTWMNVSDDPVIGLGPGAYDRYAIALNQIIKQNDVYYAYYHANGGNSETDWTTNVARSRDLVHWEKYSGNPILDRNYSSAIVVDGSAGRRLYTMSPDVRVFVNPPARSAR